ncbi:MAG: hypothetical protein ACTHZ7_15890 [Sphingobacterium sp.]
MLTTCANTGRLSKYATRAIVEKVKLHKGTSAAYQLALDYAQEVIEESGVKLINASQKALYDLCSDSDVRKKSICCRL